MAGTKVGIIGTGAISAAYFKGLALYPDLIEVTACADLRRAAAESRAAEFRVPRVLEVDELIADPDIEIVINLTIPAAHAPLNQRILAAGKHAYCEKPFGVNREEGLATIRLAREMGLRVGCAPDTVLGKGVQTCRKLIDDGAIGRPTAASAFCCGRGHEHWHPAPDFYYQSGGGPLFDMGPYYLHTLVTLLGPAQSVTAMTGRAFGERVASSKGNEGRVIPVETETHLSGLIRFTGGVVATTTFSFDCMGGARLPRIEIYGTEGTLAVPDPNRFDDAVALSRLNGSGFEPVEHIHRHEALRGTGVADMAAAIREDRPHRCSGDLAMHVLDMMCAFTNREPGTMGESLTTTCAQPVMMPL